MSKFIQRTMSTTGPPNLRRGAFYKRYTVSEFHILTTMLRKVLGLSCTTVYVSQNRDQQCFTISELAADWHLLIVSQRIVRPSIAHADC